MKKGKIIKIMFIITLIALVLVLNASNIFAAINESYYESIKDDLDVVDGNLESKVKSSTVLDAIAILVYAVGSLMEMILGLMFQGIAGTNIFPWADAILFNAVPLLDINVFNPSGASLVGIMQKFIASTYWTVFSLALSFLGIAIMVTAIKLVISTIASDKALYKQAIMKWLMGFIMLWGIHFFMSFVLYLNESLVETASKIAQDATTNASVDLASLRETSQSDKDIIDAFIKAMSSNKWTISQILTGVGITAAVIVGVVIAVHTVPAVGLIIAGGKASLAALGSGAGVAAKLGAVLSTAGKIVVATKGVGAAAVISIAATGAGLSGTIELPASAATQAQQEMIELVRTEYANKFEKNDDDFAEALGNMGLKISGSDVAVEFLSNKEVASIAARLLRNNDYVSFLQTEAGKELLSDADEWTWNGANGEKYIYELAADSLLILSDTYATDSGNQSFKELINNYLEITSAVEKERCSS